MVVDVDFRQIIELIERRKGNAYRKVNEELILLYLDIGKFLYTKMQNSKYGDKVIDNASFFFKRKLCKC